MRIRGSIQHGINHHSMNLIWLLRTNHLSASKSLHSLFLGGQISLGANANFPWRALFKTQTPSSWCQFRLRCSRDCCSQKQKWSHFYSQKVVSLRLAFVCFSILVVLQIDRAFSHLINSKQKRCCWFFLSNLLDTCQIDR